MKIERLEIKTGNLEAQKKFYSETLGLKINQLSGNSFEVVVGFSVLKFTEDKAATPYHIAFHIPPGEEKLALAWLKQKVEIQKNGDEEIVDFSAWNAMSLYFYDEDKNILEFISRKDLYPPGAESFSEKSILGIAEIGLVTNDIPQKFRILNQTCSLEKFDGNFENFCAIGDDEGLIITINNNKKDWFPTNDKAFKSDFGMLITHHSKSFKVTFAEDRLLITQ